MSTILSSDPHSVLIPELLEVINGTDISFRVKYSIDTIFLQMTSDLFLL